VRRLLLQSPAFARDLKKWLKAHADAADSIAETLEQLSADAGHVSLRTHKLRGQLAGCWACSAEHELRIVFEYVQHEGAEAIHLLALGTHDQVY
jgi:addiction module RelE/StbE family toxin